MLSAWLAHPLTRGLDLDDPRTTELRRDIVRSKPFLERIYRDWYRSLAGDLPTGPGDVLEIGSGAGFFREYVPSLITSDLMPVPGVDRVIDAHDLPFAPGALRGIAMTNVFHHLAQPRRFLAEAVRCLRPGGVVTLLEPWVTPWSCFVFQKINDEPFLPDAREWSFESTGPLSSANGALAWIIFHRDRAQFEAEFPQLRDREHSADHAVPLPSLRRPPPAERHARLDLPTLGRL